jgi:8-oxo-dGTP pyrophosphatase MutT (NUDIX family)
MKQKYVLGFVFDECLDRVLLIKKLKCPPGLESMIGSLNAIGGKLDRLGESPEMGMSRECKEESDLYIAPENWVRFAELDTKFGYVYCFYSIVKHFVEFKNGNPQRIYKQMEEEPLDLYFIEGGYIRYKHMPNLDWMIPMALNHYTGLDSATFEIKELY